MKYENLEKEMATHSSVLTCKIPGIEEPGRLQFMGFQRAGHDLATKQTQLQADSLLSELPGKPLKHMHTKN